ncbi:MAG TPA: matrixin family metalloprotease [Xanthomonadales bacterium]|nr:matrixin family metalloprotease [Xanthomonadales bacterium]
MKKLGIIIALLILLMGGYVFKEPVVTYVNNILYQSQCDTPKTFRIGKMDSKYNMSETQFVTNIDQASDLWSGYYGKKLFTYDPEGDIEVNLVYDQRSFLSTQINNLNSKVKNQQSELDPKIAQYKQKAAAFKSRAQALNNEIESWNTRGGAPPEEFERLKAAQESLRNEAASLQQEAATLNQSTDEYNVQVGQLRQTVNNFNEQLSYKPEEGEYIYNNGKETINIYFDNSQSELVHTLAHELGHALEISHNNNNLSIMYPQSTVSVTLTPEDKASLMKACARESVIKTGAEKLALIINELRLTLIR